MKTKMSIIEFLGIPPKTYESDFPQHEITDSSPYSEDNSLPITNPCSGLPLVGSTLIDIEGNLYGTCNDPAIEIDIASMDDLHQVSDTINEAFNEVQNSDSPSILSTANDSFDDAITTAFLDDGLDETFMDDSFNDDWGDW